MGAEKVAPVLETEAIVRRALGERVAVRDIPGATVTTIQHLVVAVLVREFGWTDQEVDAFVAAAEELQPPV